MVANKSENHVMALSDQIPDLGFSFLKFEVLNMVEWKESVL
jgi:hypothetical protein